MRNSRKFNELREIRITPDFCRAACGSLLFEMGNTRVICAVSAGSDVPEFAALKNTGWLTAEYSLLPYSTQPRTRRELLKKDGRSVEIQRLIGRSLRCGVDLSLMKELSLTVDCDVLQADGGTRTASITGACMALQMALRRLAGEGLITGKPLVTRVAAISVGYVDGELLLDLDYREDSKADIDLNIVLNDRYEIIEIQGSGEERAFSPAELTEMIDCAKKGAGELFSLYDKYGL